MARGDRCRLSVVGGGCAVPTAQRDHGRSGRDVGRRRAARTPGRHRAASRPVPVARRLKWPVIADGVAVREAGAADAALGSPRSSMRTSRPCHGCWCWWRRAPRDGVMYGPAHVIGRASVHDRFVGPCGRSLSQCPRRGRARCAPRSSTPPVSARRQRASMTSVWDRRRRVGRHARGMTCHGRRPRHVRHTLAP